MRAGSVQLSLCVLALWALPSLGQQRVTLENFPHDKKGALRAQVAEALCAQAECVPPSRVTVKKKLDWRKVAHERLLALVSGNVVGKGAKAKLLLTVVSNRKKILLRKTLKLVKNRVAPRPLGATVAEILSVLSHPPEPDAPPPDSGEPGASEPSETVPEKAPPADTNRPFFAEGDKGNEGSSSPPADVDAGVDAGVASTDPTPNSDTSPPPEVTDKPVDAPAPTDKKRAYPIIVAELGADVAQRSFAVQELQTANLYGWRGPIVMPSLRLEVYPLAPFTNSVAGGIGLVGDVAYAVGLNSKLPDGSTYPTHATHFDVGIKWAIRPIQGSSFNFGPEVSYKNTSFSVGAGTSGTALDQLPDLTYSGIDAGLGMEIPLGGFGTLSARGAYLPVFSASRLLSADYFTSGTASGFTGEVGLGFLLGLGQLLELRLSGIFTQYNLHFTDVGASDKYRATGTSDRYIGGRLGLRVRW